jgi:HEAT repeat protein
MRPRKARPGDERLIHDETADWGERSSALSRLAADGRLDLEPVARQWLQDLDPYLAGEGLIKLLIYWRNSPRSHEYVEVALRWLEIDEDPNKRWAAASALSECLYLRGTYAETIIPALLAALEQDEDQSVQEECYKALLRHVAPQESVALLDRGSLDFDRASDIRWDLLAPLRERYGKH